MVNVMKLYNHVTSPVCKTTSLIFDLNIQKEANILKNFLHLLFSFLIIIKMFHSPEKKYETFNRSFVVRELLARTQVMKSANWVYFCFYFRYSVNKQHNLLQPKTFLSKEIGQFFP